MNKFFLIIFVSTICLSSCTQTVSVDRTTEQVKSESFYNEGEKYFLGKGVSQDYKKAFFYFEKAAISGSAIAQNDIASMLAKGLGTSKNIEKSYC